MKSGNRDAGLLAHRELDDALGLLQPFLRVGRLNS
jgi:hypothetical protein